MPHVVHQNPDGRFVHFCTDCQAALKQPQTSRFVAWVCKCSRPVAMVGPTVTVGRETAPQRPKLPPLPPCMYLGAEVGEPIKVSCGGVYRQPRECLCPERPAAVSKRTGKTMPKLAADGWWCSDLGAELGSEPRKYQSCRVCAFRIPSETPET